MEQGRDFSPSVLDLAAANAAAISGDSEFDRSRRLAIIDGAGDYVEQDLASLGKIEPSPAGWRNKLNKRLKRFGAVVVASGIFLVAACSGDSDPVDGASAATTASSQAEFAAADEACPDSWGVVQLDNSNHQVISGGMPEIGSAEMDEEAREAANLWVDFIERDPEMLAGNANVANALAGLETSYKSSELYDAETECFNEVGVQAASELRAVVNSGRITPSEAPSDGINTGVNAEGELVRSVAGVITGNREAIKVELPNGEAFYILGRCGNLVTDVENPPKLPPGPTDEPEPEPTTTTTVVEGKYDDGRVPGPINEPGETDFPGVGPAGQTPNDNGYIPTETPPSAPATTSTTHRQTTPTTNRPTATTSPQPTSTNPPVTATTSVATTVPQTGTLPPRP